MDIEVPVPHETFDLVMGDEAVVRVRRHGNADGVRLFVSHGNGFASTATIRSGGPLAEQFEVIAFDVRNHGQNPRASSGADGHTYAQMTLDLERIVRAVARALRAQAERRRVPLPVGAHGHEARGRAGLSVGGADPVRSAQRAASRPPRVRGHGRLRAPPRRLGDEPPRSLRRPAELARQYAETRAHSTWVSGAHALMARSVLRRDETGDGWVLCCPRELEASIYLQAMTMNLWPPCDAYGGPVKLIAADPAARGAPAPAFANRALAEDLGYEYEAIPGTGHLLQIQKPRGVSPGDARLP